MCFEFFPGSTVAFPGPAALQVWQAGSPISQVPRFTVVLSTHLPNKAQPAFSSRTSHYPSSPSSCKAGSLLLWKTWTLAVALATHSETWDNPRHILRPSWSLCSIPIPGRSGPAPSCGQYTAAHSHLPLLQVKMVISLPSRRIHLGFCVHCAEQRGALSLPCCPSSGLEGQRFCEPKSHGHAATGCRTKAARGPGHVSERACPCGLEAR